MKKKLTTFTYHSIFLQSSIKIRFLLLLLFLGAVFTSQGQILTNINILETNLLTTQNEFPLDLAEIGQTLETAPKQSAANVLPK